MLRWFLWLALAVVLALGGAGLVGQLTHPPGDASRGELTWTSDQALGSRLSTISGGLQDIGSLVDALDDDAKAALVAVSSGDADGLQAALDRGAERAKTIDTTAAALRASYAELPGGDPADVTRYSGATLSLRSALGAALEAVGSLSDEWGRVAARTTDAASLTEAIRGHDNTLVDAATAGVKAQYAQAISKCDEALALMNQITIMRNDYVQPGQTTVLDDWIARHLRYDEALLALYDALKASDGKRNATVDAAYKEEEAALADLPADNREIVVIIAQVSQGGLNDAVLAIEFARGQIDAAIEAALPTPGPS
jgi:hypothetical protein